MAEHKISLVNQTALPITLISLCSIVVPGNGELDLTNSIFNHELVTCTELYNYVISDDLVFKVDETIMSKQQSLNILTPVSIIKDSTNPLFELKDAMEHKDLVNNPHEVLANQILAIIPGQGESSSSGSNITIQDALDSIVARLDELESKI